MTTDLGHEVSSQHDPHSELGTPDVDMATFPSVRELQKMGVKKFKPSINHLVHQN